MQRFEDFMSSSDIDALTKRRMLLEDRAQLYAMEALKRNRPALSKRKASFLSRTALLPNTSAVIEAVTRAEGTIREWFILRIGERNFSLRVNSKAL